MADRALLSKVRVPPGSIHRMKGEIEPKAAAAEYAAEIGDFFKLAPSQFPRFDLILPGMGEDGHTASLFPGAEAVEIAGDLAAAPFVPRLNAYRLTLTSSVLCRVRRAIFFVVGREKAEAFERALKVPDEPTRWPAQIMRTVEGEVIWLVDRESAVRIQETEAA